MSGGTMTTQQLEKLLQGLDRNDKAKINALTLLAQTEGEKEMMRAIEARLRGAEGKNKMPYWLLVDSLIKNTTGALREQLIKKLQSFLSKLVPWSVTEHTSTYVNLFHSWEGVLEPDTMQIVEECIKQSLIEHRRATVSRKKDEVRKSRVFKTLLQDAIAAAAEAPVNHDENILVPVGDIGPQADDGTETASVEPNAQDPEEKITPPSESRDASIEPQFQTIASHEVPTSVSASLADCEIPALVQSLYTKPIQCSKSGIRFPETFDMQSHKDHLYRLRTTDETKKKCRIWYQPTSEWSSVVDTGFGNMTFSDRGSAMNTKQTSKRSITAEPIKIDDVSQNIKCHVCGEAFDKKVIGGEWYILEALKTDVPNPTKAWLKYALFHSQRVSLSYFS